MTSTNFRDYVFSPDDARVASVRGLTAHEYAEAVKSDPFPSALIDGWKPLYPSKFVGITNDGKVRENIFDTSDVNPSEAAPTAAMVRAAEELLRTLTPDQTARISYPVDAVEWQSWANPEFMQYDTGLRLDEQNDSIRTAILAVVQASLSPEGFELVRSCMRINGFLGDVVELPLLMNEFSYNFAIFGTPSQDDPWGWHLFGHHVALNCLVAGDHMVISPVFLGAEPDTIDEGPFAGTRVFDERIALARDLMSQLTDSQRAKVISYEHMVDPAMPEGRVHPGDERHLGGCFQDNRVIPYEGINLAELSEVDRDLIDRIVEDFISYLPDGAREARLREIRRFHDETWFSWIGGWEGQAPFYLRIQSPVIIVELDHHCGVFLTNTEPGAFHMHTVVRTPNGNDYGRVLVERAQQRSLG